MKKESAFPGNSTMGSRIHNERIKIDAFNGTDGAMQHRGAFYIAVHQPEELKKYPSDASMNKTVFNWENDSHPPKSIDLLMRMCKLFECDIAYLLCLQDTPHLAESRLSEEMGLTPEASQKIRSLYSLDDFKTQNHVEMIALNELLESKMARRFLEMLFDMIHAEPQEHIFRCKNGSEVIMAEDDYLMLRLVDLGKVIQQMRKTHKQTGCRYTDYYRNAFRDSQN